MMIDFIRKEKKICSLSPVIIINFILLFLIFYMLFYVLLFHLTDTLFEIYE